MDSLLGHGRSLSEFQMIQILESIFSDYSGTELDINFIKLSREALYMGKGNHALLNDH